MTAASSPRGQLVALEIESIEAVEEWLGRLPRVHAMACRLIYLYGQDQNTVAESVGCSKSFLSRLHREALTMLIKGLPGRAGRPGARSVRTVRVSGCPTTPPSRAGGDQRPKRSTNATLGTVQSLVQIQSPRLLLERKPIGAKVEGLRRCWDKGYGSMSAFN